MFGVLRPPSPSGRPPPTADDAPPPPGSLAPMPPREFKSREDVLNSTKEWAANQGYAIVIARSRANRLWLKCDRGGNYENRRNLTDEVRKRKRGESRLLGCPFKMIAMVKRDGSWKVETETPAHNHGPSEDLSLHPTLRRMNQTQMAKVHEMFDAGRSPAETLEELKATWPDMNILTRDIYNARKKYKTQKEEAEAGDGRADMPAPDPNGVFPGPDENGRWAWVPKGEEVTNTQSKARQKTNTAQPAATSSPPRHEADETLDPQLQGSSPMLQLQHAARTLPSLDALMNPSASEHGESSHDPRYRDTHRRSHEGPTLIHGLDGSADSVSANLSDVRREPADRAPAIVNIHNPSPVESNGVDSPVVLAARIERMEKEQQDQKNMLAQILGAVKSMSGSTPI